MSCNNHPSKHGMDDDDSNQLPKLKRLKTLAYSVADTKGNNQLHQFVLNQSDPNDSGSANKINAVLRSMSGVSVNALNKKGYSALHLAVRKSNLLLVKKLLSYLTDIDVNIRSVYFPQNTALHFAIESGQVDVFQELLNKGAEIEIQNAYGLTALCSAALSGNLDIMDRLLKKGANVNPINLQKGPLCYAFRSGNLKAVTLLLSKGAHIHAENIWSLLHCAARSGNLGIFQFLLDSGVNVNRKSEKWSQLLLPATRSGNLETIRLIIDEGADVHITDEEGGTPLHSAVQALSIAPDRAARCKGLEIVEFLIGIGIDVNARNKREEIPLHEALLSSFKRNLYRRGDDLNARWYTCLETIKLLISKGADVNARDKNGRIPLHYASTHLETTEFLVGKGADVNARDISGQTPLYLALYITFNRNVFIKDKSLIAEWYALFEIVKFLVNG